MRISDMNWMQVEAYLKADDRCILPLGSTEQHAQLSACASTHPGREGRARGRRAARRPGLPGGALRRSRPISSPIPARSRCGSRPARRRPRCPRQSSPARLPAHPDRQRPRRQPAGGALAIELMAEHPGVSVKFHNWWNAPETWPRSRRSIRRLARLLDGELSLDAARQTSRTPEAAKAGDRPRCMRHPRPKACGRSSATAISAATTRAPTRSCRRSGARRRGNPRAAGGAMAEPRERSWSGAPARSAARSAPRWRGPAQDVLLVDAAADHVAAMNRTGCRDRRPGRELHHRFGRSRPMSVNGRYGRIVLWP